MPHLKKRNITYVLAGHTHSVYSLSLPCPTLRAAEKFGTFVSSLLFGLFSFPEVYNLEAFRGGWSKIDNMAAA